MPLLLIALLAAGGYAVYEKKKNPNWNPLASITGQKSAALSKVAQTSTPTPASTAGLDPNMTSAQVAAAQARGGLLFQPGTGLFDVGGPLHRHGSDGPPATPLCGIVWQRSRNHFYVVKQDPLLHSRPRWR